MESNTPQTAYETKTIDSTDATATDLSISVSQWHQETKQTSHKRTLIYVLLLLTFLLLSFSLLIVGAVYHHRPQHSFAVDVKPNTVISILTTLIKSTTGVLLGSVAVWSTWARAEDPRGGGVSLQQINECGYATFGVFRTLVFLKHQPGTLAFGYVASALALLALGPLAQASVGVGSIEVISEVIVGVPALNLTKALDDLTTSLVPHSTTGVDVNYIKGMNVALYGSQPDLPDAGCGANCTYVVQGLGWDTTCGRFSEADFLAVNLTTSESGITDTNLTIPILNLTFTYTAGEAGPNAYLSDVYNTTQGLTPGSNDTLTHTTVFMRTMNSLSPSINVPVPGGVQGGWCTARLGAFNYTITGDSYTRTLRQPSSDEVQLMSAMIDPFVTSGGGTAQFPITDTYSGTADSFHSDVAANALFGPDPNISVYDVQATIQNAYEYAGLILMNTSNTATSQVPASISSSVIVYRMHLEYIWAAIILTVVPVLLCAAYAFPTPGRLRYLGTNLSGLILADAGPGLRRMNASAGTGEQVEKVGRVFATWREVRPGRWHREFDVVGAADVPRDGYIGYGREDS